MPRILDHHEALMDCADAKFSALLYKDHFYLGVSHAMILEKLFPETGVKLFSGIALNNASGGINPHAVNHAINIGAKIVWLPTLSAANHIEKLCDRGEELPEDRQEDARSDPAQRARRERQALGRHQAGARPDRRGRHHPGGRPSAGLRAASRVRRGEGSAA